MISNAAHTPAAKITVPSPKGRWNSLRSARCLSSARIDAPVRTIASSTKENGPKVLTISNSAPVAAAFCSTLSRFQSLPIVERLAPVEPGVGLVPEADLILTLLPAEVDLLALP